ncbi:hypothetical protein M409DRAFT_50813 [Zasmidium cellare ATCC 36951]|uniref:Uncharacterized protein n=1 Tax=Zasmidium cellare ATCC 36951 TaxID=1080233 RepID=A0A6A6CW77_ZASCE|nr:uncharacterized protein M409DRAFT_50813 [Zasmidium cellare ATCC 36951]KAF2171361.1 hypothetical protein M409DRAFT_50813 [Zasmidium cellare ATCC 36951]
MAGFTPINASASGGIASSQSQFEGSREASDQHPTRTVASEYLGRKEDLPAAPLPKKIHTKGKKRAATAGDAGKTNKRRRSSNIDDRLHVTKSRGQDEKSSKPDCTDKPAKSSKPKKKTAACKQPKKSSGTVSSSNAEAGMPMTKPVSVYAQTTSMDALDSTSAARTSFDSVRANAGQSFTLYQGPSSNSSFHSNVLFSQPLLTPVSNTCPHGSHANAGATDEAEIGDDFTLLSSDDDILGAEVDLNLKISKQPHLPDRKKDTASSRASITEDGNRRTTRQKKAVNYAVEQSFPSIDEVQDIQLEAPDKAKTKSPRRRSTATLGGEDDFGDIPEDEVVELTKEVEEAVEEGRPVTPPPRNRKQDMREVDEHEDYEGALLSDAERKLLAKMKNASEGKIKPIVRKPFLPAVLDRSPIFGASKSTVVRTSFRLGEALNFGAQAVRCNENAIIELYARATVSRREGRKQHFVFKDLYHDNPPYLEGTYELWDQARLWDLDSKPFLKARGPGILSRVIARMKRESQKWRLEILNVWEASWGDVNYVAGIYTGEVYEEDEYNI